MNVSDFIFSYLKDKLPSINWNIGSTIRELIASPITIIAERAIKALNSQVNAVSVQAYLEDSDLYADDINNTFAALGLQENKSVLSEGIITILTHSDKPGAVYKNTSMYYNDQVVIVAEDTYPSITYKANEGFTQLRQIGYKSYMFDVKVRAYDANTYLANGTKLVWDEAPDDIYDITVSSAVSGGRTEMTLAEKAESIKNYVAPNVLTLNDGITKQLKETLPDIVVDAKYATDIIDNTKSYLYVKTTKAPGYYFINVTGYRNESGLYVVQTSELGIISILSAYKNDISVNIQQIQINNNSIYCTLEYKDGGPVETFSLQVYGMQDAKVIQNFIDGYTLGSPFNIEVKAPSTFDLSVEFKYTGQELTDQQVKEICALVQFSGLNKLITDNDIRSIIEPYGAILVGSGIYTLTGFDGSSYKQKYTPSVYASTYNNYAIYTSVSKVNAYYV
jgi:hypothetical protein